MTQIIGECELKLVGGGGKCLMKAQRKRWTDSTLSGGRHYTQKSTDDKWGKLFTVYTANDVNPIIRRKVWSEATVWWQLDKGCKDSTGGDWHAVSTWKSLTSASIRSKAPRQSVQHTVNTERPMITLFTRNAVSRSLYTVHVQNYTALN